MRTLASLFYLGVEERHIKGSMARGLLCLDRSRSHLLPPSHVQSAERVHPETFEVDARDFGGRPENVLL